MTHMFKSEACSFCTSCTEQSHEIMTVSKETSFKFFVSHCQDKQVVSPLSFTKFDTSLNICVCLSSYILFSVLLSSFDSGSLTVSLIIPLVLLRKKYLEKIHAFPLANDVIIPLQSYLIFVHTIQSYLIYFFIFYLIRFLYNIIIYVKCHIYIYIIVILLSALVILSLYNCIYF